MKFNLDHSLGQFSRQQIDDIFLIFPRKQDLTFYANCLQWRQFAWNVYFCFLHKKKKKNISQNIPARNKKILPRMLSLKFAISAKGNNYCDFLFALLHAKTLLKSSLKWKNLLPYHTCPNKPKQFWKNCIENVSTQKKAKIRINIFYWSPLLVDEQSVLPHWWLTMKFPTVAFRVNTKK